jgi:hypothetical protein
MGHTALYARRLDLAAMSPRGELSSTGCCLAHPGSEYLIFQPADDTFTVELQEGTYAVEWFEPNVGEANPGSPVTAAGKSAFTPPFAGGTVLYLKRS